MLSRIFSIFTSLRLTVACLFMSMILVFIGTIGQVKLGLYVAQEKYFRSLLVWWGPEGADWKIPVWPGGWLLGGILLLNLIAAYAKRFELCSKKIGLYLIHSGLILMFIGQFATEVLQVETNMTIPSGESRNYSESSRKSEIAVIDSSDPSVDSVVSIPESFLKPGKEIAHPSLPFKLKVREYMPNSEPKMGPNGTTFSFSPMARATKMDDRDIPAAVVEVETGSGTNSVWNLANWLSEDRLVAHLKSQLGPFQIANAFKPASFTHNGHTYTLVMRPERHYKPFTLQLLNFSHDKYMGTDIPKNFSSRIRLTRPETKEDREILIYMNNPLRYAGETYYQSSFLPGDAGTILQVVRNPGWLTPYVACILVGGGLTWQFMFHLLKFRKKRTT